jgi:hypothetical protein
MMLTTEFNLIPEQKGDPSFYNFIPRRKDQKKKTMTAGKLPIVFKKLKGEKGNFNPDYIPSQLIQNESIAPPSNATIIRLESRDIIFSSTSSL